MLENENHPVKVMEHNQGHYYSTLRSTHHLFEATIDYIPAKTLHQPSSIETGSHNLQQV
jgi:hypothetical protein